MGRIVLTTGCFDPLHVGHIACLNAARELGDYLVVALTTDAQMAKEKGEGRPFQPWFERALALRSLRCVDRVIFNTGDFESLVRIVRPFVFAKGSEYKGRLREEAFCKASGILVEFLDTKPIYSSTRIISGEEYQSRLRATGTGGA